MTHEVKTAKLAIKTVTTNVQANHTWAELAKLSPQELVARYKTSTTTNFRNAMKLQQVKARGYSGDQDEDAMHFALDWWQFNSSARY